MEGNFTDSSTTGAQPGFGFVEDVDIFSMMEEPTGGAAPITANPADVGPIQPKPKDDKAKPDPKEEPGTDPDEEKDEPRIDILDELEAAVSGDKNNPKDDKTVDPQEDVDDPSDDINPFTALENDLISMGILSGPEEDDEDYKPATKGEELRNKFNQEIRNKTYNYLYNNVLAAHGDEGREMFESIFLHGVKPEDYLRKYNEVQSVANLDLEDDYTKQNLVKDYYIRRGWKPEAVTKKVQSLVDTGDIDLEAENIHAELLASEEKTFQEMKQRAALQKQQKEQADLYYKQNLDQILSKKLKDKEFDGLPITPKLKEEVVDDLTVPRYQLADGTLLTTFDAWVIELAKPENHELKAWFWMMVKEKQKDPSLSVIKQKGVKETTNELFNNSIRKNKTERRTTPRVDSEPFV